MTRTVQAPPGISELFEEAEALVSAYFERKRETPEHGRIEIDGERYILVRAPSLSIEFADMVRRMYPGNDEEGIRFAGNLLFHLAHTIGRADAEAFHDKLGLSDPISRMSAGPVHFAHTGWAFVDIHAESNPVPNADFRLVYDHPYSFESASWRRAGRKASAPACSMNAGYSSGWCEASFGIPLVAAEILCTARGDDCCRFLMAPPEGIHEHIQSYLAAHPELVTRVGQVEVPGPFESVELATRLQESEARYRQLFESSMDAIVVVEGGHIARANRSARELLGRCRPELTGATLAQLSPPRQPDGRGSAKRLEELQTRALEGEPQHVAWRFSCGECEHIETEMSIGRIGGQATALEVIVHDITERRRLEHELRHLQKMDALGTLAGGIAHDFNNLLTVIGGNLDLLELELGSAETTRGRKRLDGARQALEHSTGIVRQLLAFSRVSQDAEELVDLREIARENVTLLRDTIDRRIELHLTLADEPVWVRGDPSYLTQVVMNLVLNARDALADFDAGTPRINVEVQRAQQTPPDSNGQVVPVAGLVVRDNGPGMDAETRSRVFEPFFTTRGAGSGLGLSTVYGIVRQHDGWIEIDSAPSEGATFSVWLPCTTDVPEPSADSRDAEAPTDARRATVLVVEDEPTLRTVIGDALRNVGLDVLMAANGADGLEVYRAQQAIDVVLLDLTMPGMSGRELLKHILALNPNQTVVVTSGYSTDAAIDELLAEGAHSFLPKPYRLERLLQTLREALPTSPTDY